MTVALVDRILGVVAEEPMTVGKGFHTTRWSIVLEAGDQSAEQCQRALAELCRTYWYPLFGFARRESLGKQDAEDAVQGFFADLLAREDISRVSPSRGRFRSFLLAAFKNFLAKQFREQRALKRGGGQIDIPIDADWADERLEAQMSHHEAPDVAYDRAWALALLDAAIVEIASEYEVAGRPEVFTRLRVFLPTAEPPPTMSDLAADLDISVGAATMAVHRMRRRFGEVVRSLVAETVDAPADVDSEIDHLMKMVG